MEKISNKDFVARIAEESGLSKKQAGEVIRIIFEEIRKQICAGMSVSIYGFGIFGVADRKARTGINPATKKPIEIPAKKLPVFKPFNSFKEEVNG